MIGWCSTAEYFVSIRGRLLRSYRGLMTWLFATWNPNAQRTLVEIISGSASRSFGDRYWCVSCLQRFTPQHILCECVRYQMPRTLACLECQLPLISVFTSESLRLNERLFLSFIRFFSRLYWMDKLDKIKCAKLGFHPPWLYVPPQLEIVIPPVQILQE